MAITAAELAPNPGKLVAEPVRLANMAGRLVTSLDEMAVTAAKLAPSQGKQAKQPRESAAVQKESGIDQGNEQESR